MITSCAKPTKIDSFAAFDDSEITKTDSVGNILNNSSDPNDWKVINSTEMSDADIKNFDIPNFTTYYKKDTILSKSNCNDFDLSVIAYRNPVKLGSNLYIKLLNPNKKHIVGFFITMLNQNNEMAENTEVPKGSFSSKDSVIVIPRLIHPALAPRGLYFAMIVETEDGCIKYFKGKVNIDDQ